MQKSKINSHNFPHNYWTSIACKKIASDRELLDKSSRWTRRAGGIWNYHSVTLLMFLIFFIHILVFGPNEARLAVEKDNILVTYWRETSPLPFPRKRVGSNEALAVRREGQCGGVHLVHECFEQAFDPGGRNQRGPLSSYGRKATNCKARVSTQMGKKFSGGLRRFQNEAFNMFLC